MSPKKYLSATEQVLAQSKRVIDLSIIFIYLRAYLNKWPSTKSEVSQYLSKLPFAGSKKEKIERMWEIISPEISDLDIKEIHSRKTQDWNFNLRSLLESFSNIEEMTEGFSQDFLGEFVKDFAHTKFGDDVKSVFDPAFGLGNILFAAFDGSSPKKDIWLDDDGEEIEVSAVIARHIQGNEINSDFGKLVKTLGEICGYKINIQNQDSLILPDATPSKHELVVCEPPAGQKLSPELIKQDWSFGPPPSGRADWAWAQIVNSHISSEGYGLLFLLRGALFQHNDTLMRAKMINSGSIRAVINLPSGSNWSSRMPMSLIIFAGEKVPRAKGDEILFLSLPVPTGRQGSWEHASSLLKSIHDACEVFYGFEKGKFERVIGYSAILDRNDKSLVNNSWNLDPSNYVTQVATGIDVELNVRQNMNRIAKSADELVSQIRRAKDKFSTFSVKAEFTTIGEMIKSGKLIQVTGMSKNDMSAQESNESNTDSYLTVNDLRKVGPLHATGKVYWGQDQDDREEIRTDLNDVVFIKTGTPAAKVDYHGGSLLFSPLSALRITEKGEKVVTPKILAYILNGESIKKFMHGVSVGRLAIEKVPIPILESMNRIEIDEHLMAVEKLILKLNELGEELNVLDQMLSKVLWGEFVGLQEANR